MLYSSKHDSSKVFWSPIGIIFLILGWILIVVQLKLIFDRIIKQKWKSIKEEYKQTLMIYMSITLIFFLSLLTSTVTTDREKMRIKIQKIIDNQK